ncbi:MAG TPA: helix-turn-helix domain-containing protein [Holophaga sp.]|nr:helix-turn-helix domain-containing protein [Holophaga sp.]
MTERLWFKIGETAERIGATPKELRYWERVIPELKPRRSKGNLRYYHVDEFPRLQKIRAWLSEGLTVADCRELLLTGQLARPLLLDLGLEDLTPAPAVQPARLHAGKSGRGAQPDLRPVIKALKTLVERLSKPPHDSAAPKAALDH